MSGLPLVFGYHTRRTGRFPPFANENLFAEAAPSNQDKGLALIGRPGLTDFTGVATGPVRALFYQAGLFGGDRFILAGPTLYRIATNATVTAVTGTVAGSERVSVAAGLNSLAESELRIATGSELYLYDGTSVALETFAGTAGASSIDYIRGMWIASHTDTQELYFRFLDDATWTALAFQSAEYTPDKAVAVTHLGDQVVVMGETSVELFALSGDAVNPLTPYGAGLINEIGCRARDSVVRLQDALYMVGDDCQVYKLTPSPKVISDPGLTEILRGAAANTLVAWGYLLDGHEYYVLATEVGSFVYDSLTGFWSKASSYGETYWRPWFGVQIGASILVADGNPGNGTLWNLDPEALTDDGEPIVARFCAWLEIPEGRLEVFNLVLNCATGWSPLAGQGSAPLIKCRAYRDGTVPGPWREASLGSTGQYDGEVRWNRCGQFKGSGVLFEFEVSDPVVRRITGVRANVA